MRDVDLIQVHQQETHAGTIYNIYGKFSTEERLTQFFRKQHFSALSDGLLFELFNFSQIFHLDYYCPCVYCGCYNS